MLGALLAVAVIWQMLQFHAAVGLLLNTLSLLVLGGPRLVHHLSLLQSASSASRMIVLIVLTISTVVFWALFEQSAASMTLFADRVMDRKVFGLSPNAAHSTAPSTPCSSSCAHHVFAWLWTVLAARGREPSTPLKFALGIAQAVTRLWRPGHSAPPTRASAGLVSGYWMILAYLLHTTGELCLSPVGLSAVTKLAVHQCGRRDDGILVPRYGLLGVRRGAARKACRAGYAPLAMSSDVPLRHLVATATCLPTCSGLGLGVGALSCSCCRPCCAA
jgi:POT family proton-dependent oligopeptide transporter